ncbi:hypothetical protein P154DRAFT_527724 [Amniculicola lignicola CBS 123094]|uniref:Uncharacterized protein n=1 Tax=Amniculicola lignicola CBS 123094 TaxID=1392246 RepID=A0A6A5VXQ7_9PLEO|nr:hypothetical protein P154DRAFT_527724 [Amniculicola lignicola CBS 123094]
MLLLLSFVILLAFMTGKMLLPCFVYCWVSPNRPADSKNSELAMETHSSLLSLPMELRLLMYDYMTLSPLSEGADDWTGLYYSCWQTVDEMQGYLKPLQGVKDFLDTEEERWNEWHGGWPLRALPRYSFGVLVEVSLSLPANLVHDRNLELITFNRLSPLFKLYINHLVLKLPGIPHGDLKSIPRAWHAYYDRFQQLNCKTLTITLEHMVGAEGGRSKSTSLDNTFKCKGCVIPYTLTIVQDKDDDHVEKVYHSATRFRPI